MNGWTRAALVGAAVGAGVLGYTAARRMRSASEHRPPGSQGLPFIGETLSYSSNPHRFIEERHQKHGDVFKTRILGDDVVCFVGPEAFTFFTESPYFDRQGGSPKNVRELLAHESLPLLGGEQHREARSKVQQAFTQDAVSGLVGGIQAVLESYAERWAHKGTFRWVDEFKSLSATMCADMLLGEGGPERHRDDLVPVLDEFLAGLNSVPLNLPFTTYGRAIRRRDELLGMIDRARRNKVGYSHYDILSLLISARGEDGGRLPEAQLRAHILHMLFAAYGNIFRVLSLMAMDLGRHREIAEQARQEVMRVASFDPEDDRVDLATLARLPYLDQVTREVRRHNRIFATTFMDQVTGTFEYRGYRVPAGWKAMAGIYTTMQDDTVFSNPGVFDPGRFSPERAEDRKQENSYVPHGGGPDDGHRCPAEDFTTVIMKLAGVVLLRSYMWEFPPQDFTLDDQPSPLPRDGLQVHFKRHPMAAMSQRT